MTHCRMCGASIVTKVLDAGKQALGNRFLQSQDEDEFTHPKQLGVCAHCGLVQLLSPAPAAEMAPRFAWLTFTEPEGHLDALAEVLADLPGLDANSELGAISYKDDTLLERMRNKRFSNTWRVDIKADLGSDNPAGVETVQERLAAALPWTLSTHRGQVSLLLARHILEHVHAIPEFALALRSLLRPEGYLLVEVPCCEKHLERGDYSMLWDEHTQYFTSVTLQHFCAVYGFEIVRLDRAEYPLEDSLVALCRMVAKPEAPVQFVGSDVNKEVARVTAYGERFPETANKVRSAFQDELNRGGKIAFFGACDLGGMFVNMLGLQDFVDFFVDDNPHKSGLFMPGSKIPVLPSSALLDKEITLCLLCLNPAIEDKVIANNSKFTGKGGRFCSIFPGSPNAFSVLKEG